MMGDVVPEGRLNPGAPGYERPLELIAVTKQGPGGDTFTSAAQTVPESLCK